MGKIIKTTVIQMYKIGCDGNKDIDMIITDTKTKTKTNMAEQKDPVYVDLF